jgi:hypothetical protein
MTGSLIAAPLDRDDRRGRAAEGGSIRNGNSWEARREAALPTGADSFGVDAGCGRTGIRRG